MLVPRFDSSLIPEFMYVSIKTKANRVSTVSKELLWEWGVGSQGELRLL